MGKWVYTVKPWGSIIERDDLTLEEKRDQLVQSLRASRWCRRQDENSELFDAIEDLEDATEEVDMDHALDAIYDLADNERAWLCPFED